MKIITAFGHWVNDIILKTSGMFLLLLSMISGIGYSLKRPILIVKAIHFCGVRSVVIIAVSGLFVGMVLGLQGYNTLVRFGSVSMLGSVVALSLLRELSPVLSAILFASRAGTGIAAEIGLMRATKQIDALSVMAVSPINRVLMPRFMGGLFSVPLLCAIFSVSGILGGYLIGVCLLHVDSGIFMHQIHTNVKLYEDVVNGLIKSLVFGATVSLIAVYHGYTAKPTAEGVSLATTQTVVLSALTVLALDFVLTAFMF